LHQKGDLEMNKLKRLGCPPFLVLALLGAIASQRTLNAGLLYATSINTGIIYSVDTSTHVVTPVFNTGAALDSLFFDASGRIIYSQLNAGTVQAFNPATNTNVTVQSGLTAPIDMALEPSLTSFLVSDSTSHLVRVSLSGGILGSLNVGSRPDGVTYSPSGNLYVNISSGFQVNNSQVELINPTTGAVLATTGNTGLFLDGLTYDSFSGFLYASDYNNGRIVKINPTTMAFSVLTPLGAALSQPDGITSDGNGDLFLASRANSTVMQYNIATNTDTAIATINGLDDLAPASGLGAPVPEPGSFVLLSSLLCGCAIAARRRFARP
jgi:streptogramin lyase